MDERDENHLINEMKTNRDTTLRGLTTFMSDTLGHSIPKSSIRRTIRRSGLFSCLRFFSWDGNTRVLRYPQEGHREEFITTRLQCEGVSIMVWGCVRAGGVGPLKTIKNTLDQYAYMDMMKRKLLPFMEYLSENNDGEFIYQEDNAPCPKSKLAEE
ncbi:hypothetical protein PHYBLDRAFT_158656 [Phycomyces blakesleeanus NRRL 1555(-)]|uniref:Homeodomain-like DNA binding domain-containing transcription factor n=1 Tax=Phycomyces blakesleeanus (strain ATCC 8743b / DSM 1359 / FGSC 10004 / NBRC 33097 / NRRL 1555) TaxID=763407 RepID=A0A167MW70_PHYB8|nr:hypothetical protein PHYBLDRAFT_158656 [Phycomyces blakesleeanus NRRL 1555(-)]OAD74234.1 hypothetical protein PHYBLDRAFT_158656 [Phycomyces blakesleeanus NRRL 1555(-)]|eukprot:XP_018292274.1 hypothetical protein PHYBLDRAFT_158656 [Phycomyces blakesleeanus NRRL 1555(-)]